MLSEIVFPIGSVVLLGFAFVLLPTMLDVYKRYKWRTAVECPETGRTTAIHVDAGRAARSAMFGDPKLRVQECARWPSRMECDQACLKDVAWRMPAKPTFPNGGWTAPKFPPAP